MRLEKIMNSVEQNHVRRIKDIKEVFHAPFSALSAVKKKEGQGEECVPLNRRAFECKLQREHDECGNKGKNTDRQNVYFFQKGGGRVATKVENAREYGR